MFSDDSFLGSKYSFSAFLLTDYWTLLRSAELPKLPMEFFLTDLDLGDYTMGIPVKNLLDLLFLTEVVPVMSETELSDTDSTSPYLRR